LEGITRRTVIQLLRDDLRDGSAGAAGSIEPSSILPMKMFFCGTGAQISAITRVDHRLVGTGKIGEVTGRLRKLYFDVVRGRIAKYRDWCYPVYEIEKKVTPTEHSHVSVK
jgi:branched-chain amino acid aminotransferase